MAPIHQKILTKLRNTFKRQMSDTLSHLKTMCQRVTLFLATDYDYAKIGPGFKSKPPEKRGGLNRRIRQKTGTLPWAGSHRNFPGSPADYHLKCF